MEVGVKGSIHCLQSGPQSFLHGEILLVVLR